MTVTDLIIALSQLPPHAHVWILAHEDREVTDVDTEHSDARTDAPALEHNAPKGPVCVILR